MGMNFGIDTYNIDEIIRTVLEEIDVQDIDITNKKSPNDLVWKAAEDFGVVDGGNVHVLSCEYWEEYDPSINFPRAVAGYYGLKGKYGDGFSIVWDLASNHYGAGVSAAEWLDEFGIELDEDD